MGTIEIKCKGSGTIPITELENFQGNLKTLGKPELEKLKDSILKHGFSFPVIVWGRKIIDGHQRVFATKQLLKAGYTIGPVPVVEIDAQNDKEAAEKLLVLNSNYARITEQGLMDFSAAFDLVLKDMAELSLVDIDIEKLFAVEKGPGLTDEDSVPDTPEKAITKQGQMYIMGEHVLLCGDSSNQDDLARLMANEKADMVLTDPPYDIHTDGGGVWVQKSTVMSKIKKAGIDTFEPSMKLQLAKTCIFFCNKPLVKKYLDMAEANGLAYNICFYKKDSHMPNYGGHMMTDVEYIIILGSQAPVSGLNWEMYSKVYIGKKDTDNPISWSKPVELCEKFIRLYSKKMVLDLFGGSGSTLIACEKSGRACRMMELNPIYCDLIVARWQAYTGQQAVVIDGPA